MTKQEFLIELQAALNGLPQNNIKESILFYSEMIDDRIDDGMSEEEAVADIGSVDEAASQIIAEIPLMKIAKEKIKPKRKMKAWEIVLLCVGSPIWGSLLIAAFAVIISLYAALWSVIIALWSVFVSFAACAVALTVVGAAYGVVGGVVFINNAHIYSGIVMFAAGLVLAGLSIFTFFGCKAATKGIIILTKKLAFGLKSLFIRKEKA